MMISAKLFPYQWKILSFYSLLDVVRRTSAGTSKAFILWQKATFYRFIMNYYCCYCYCYCYLNKIYELIKLCRSGSTRMNNVQVKGGKSPWTCRRIINNNNNNAKNPYGQCECSTVYEYIAQCVCIHRWERNLVFACPLCCGCGVCIVECGTQTLTGPTT